MKSVKLFSLKKLIGAFFLIFSTFNLNAQLYSSGNNTITGTSVGVGTNLPATTLDIKPASYTWTGQKRNPFQVQYFSLDCPTCLGVFKTAIYTKWDGSIGFQTNNPLEKFHVNTKSLFIGNMTIEGSLFVKDANGEIQFKVDADGNVRAREVKVDLLSIPPDYVFSENYNLMPLDQLKKFIQANKHLPNIKSANEIENDGFLSLNEMNFKLLEKVEELTLYMIQLQEEMDSLKIELNKLKQ